jgi:type IV pilus assembly protein PilC
MSSYSYVAVDPQGMESRGTLDVPDQSEALRRIKEMGLFPTKVLAAAKPCLRLTATQVRPRAEPGSWRLRITGWGGGLRAATLTVFTRQLATLIEAGLPLLRGLRTLREQAEDRTLRRIITELSQVIEGGSSFAEALALHPRVFNCLYLNMVKAGEVKAAMYYPCAVLTVATLILTLLMTYVVPRFKEVFEGLLGGGRMPPFTLFVLRLSEAMRSHIFLALMAAAGLALAIVCALRTVWGRWSFDQFKLAMPVLGTVFRKVAISRFSRTLGTLLGSGVPILQALTIVKETAGNVVVGEVISDVHQQVKQGEPIAPALKASGVFPAMVVGMVDVGEQTGALPEMLLKIADTYDDEVDNAVSAMTSLLELIMIVFLAVIVGSIVVALFLPLVSFPMQADNLDQSGPRDN